MTIIEEVISPTDSKHGRASRRCPKRAKVRVLLITSTRRGGQQRPGKLFNLIEL